MNARVWRTMMKPLAAVLFGVLLFGATVEMLAQRASEASTPEGQPPPAVQGGGGGRGRGGRGGPVPTGRLGAPVDLTGTWVAVVTEDWQWRMRTAPKGDTTSVPLNPEGTRVANTWEPTMDGRCEAYGIGGVMRMPLRVKISWQDDLTLKIETDAGQQTRLLRFAAPGAAASPVSAPAGRTLQGTSVAEWQRSGGAFDAFLERGAGAPPPRWGALKVTTTNVLPGWLRRNGVPYSQNATITEYFTRVTNPDAGDWFVVTTTVDDPTYLGQPFTTSSNFKKEANDSKWNPAPCKAG
ncbi:MAG TPA: hypothetical protein VI485_24000 [Vicinamibacterales bacterium]|nr:hypothetical protein [Vicinamibacterales bacterium]